MALTASVPLRIHCTRGAYVPAALRSRRAVRIRTNPLRERAAASDPGLLYPTWESRLAKRASRLRGPCTPMHNSTSCRRDATASAASSCCLLQAVPRPARARLRFRGWFDLCGVGIGQRLCCRLLCGRNVNFDCSFFFNPER